MPLFVGCRFSSRVIGTPELLRRESGANPLAFFMDLHKFARDPRLKDVAFSVTFLREVQVVRRGPRRAKDSARDQRDHNGGQHDEA